MSPIDKSTIYQIMNYSEKKRADEQAAERERNQRKQALFEIENKNRYQIDLMYQIRIDVLEKLLSSSWEPNNERILRLLKHTTSEYLEYLERFEKVKNK